MNLNPLTTDEVHAASDRFFPLFDIILRNMPEGSKTEDCIKVMESVCALAHKMRLEDHPDHMPFGFNKQKQKEEEV